MVTVYVWLPSITAKQILDGQLINVGHASIDIAGRYYSWWPGPEFTKLKTFSDVGASLAHVSKERDVNRKLGIEVNKGLKEDIIAESGNPDVVTINGLDEKKMIGWLTYGVGINKVNLQNRTMANYNLLSTNCSWLVGSSLKVGIPDNINIVADTSIWTPRSVLSFAKEISKSVK